MLKTHIHKNKDKGIWSHHYSASRKGKPVETVAHLVLFSSQTTKNGDCSYQKQMSLAFGCKSYEKPRHCIIKKTQHLIKLSVIMKG